MNKENVFRIDLIDYSFGRIIGKKSLLKSFCSFRVQGAHFSKQFKEKKWDGTTSFIKYNKLPLGLLPYFIRETSSRDLVLEFYLNNSRLSPNELDEGIFSGPGLNTATFIEMITLFPDQVVSRYYQLDSLENILKSSRGMIVLPTGSGKSLSIYMLTYMLRSKFGLGLILVPRVSLVDQLARDFQLFSGNTVHVLTSSEHGRQLLELVEEKNNVIISTWQSWSSWIEDGIALDPDYVIIDEAHTLAKGSLVQDYMKALKNTRFRYGMTATENEMIYDRLNLEGLLGPILYKELPEKLIEQGFLAKPHIIRLFIEHYIPKSTTQREERIQTRDLVRRPERMRYISHFIQENLPINASLLILTEAIDEEIIPLCNILHENLVDTDVYSMTRISTKIERSRMIDIMNKPERQTILVVTYGLFQMGINIPNLSYIMLFSPSRSHIRVLQSIGRALRPDSSCFVFDLIDYCDEKRDNMASKRLAIYKGAYGDQLELEDKFISL